MRPFHFSSETPVLLSCNPVIKPRYLSLPLGHAVQPRLQVAANGGFPGWDLPSGHPTAHTHSTQLPTRMEARDMSAAGKGL